jgi:3-deoxy-D-manno-octulosonic-acid transferase
MNLLAVSERLGRIFMTLLGRSWRVLYVKPPHGGRLGSARGRNVLFSFWHGRQLPLIYTHGHEGISVLVSINRDGQYAANILHGMGFSTVRGSTSLGGFEAVQAISRILRSGRDCAITPDGPRGPAGILKPGLVHMMRRGKVPVVPMGASGWPSVRMRSWDRFMLVLPFSRMTVVEGQPQFLEKAPDQKALISMIRTETDRVTGLADLLSCPVARMWAFFFRLTGRFISAPAFLWLLTRQRRERKERTGRIEQSFRRPVWIHGSSIGELHGILPVVRELQTLGLPVHVTCFTHSGRNLLEESGIPGSWIPLDSPGWAGRFLDRLNPRALVLSETELWPNILHATVTRNIPSIMINARLSIKSARRYKPVRHLIAGILSCFAAVMCRTDQDRERFERLGVPGDLLITSGDSKSLAPAEKPDAAWREKLSSTGRKVLVAGSTRPGEEKEVIEACAGAGWLPVIAPRHLHRTGEVMAVAKAAGMNPVLWSSILPPGRVSSFGSVVVDRHGILARLYGAADAAFVGGTIAPIGGHNVLEPLQQGVPVIVGENHSSFEREVEEAVRIGAGFVIQDAREMISVLEDLALNPADEEIAARAGRFAGDRFLVDLRRVLTSAGLILEGGRKPE